MTKLLIRANAKHDIVEASSWYERQRPGLGTAFLHELDTAIARVVENPAQFALFRDSLSQASSSGSLPLCGLLRPEPAHDSASSTFAPTARILPPTLTARTSPFPTALCAADQLSAEADGPRRPSPSLLAAWRAPQLSGWLGRRAASDLPSTLCSGADVLAHDSRMTCGNA